MSTKIYSGYKLRKGVSLFDLQKKFYRIMRDAAQNDLMVEITRRTIEKADRIAIGDKKSKADLKNHYKKFVGIAGFEEVKTFGLEQCLEYTLFKNLYAKKDDPNKIELDHCSLSIFENTNRDEIYLYFYGNSDHEDIFRNWPEVEEFAYWNNSDQPEHISDEAWEDRIKAWEEAVNLDKPFRAQGLLIDPISENDSIVTRSTYQKMITSKTNHMNFPTYENRVKSSITTLLSNEFAKEAKLKKVVFDFSDYMSFIEDREKRASLKSFVEKRIQPLSLEEYTFILFPS